MQENLQRRTTTNNNNNNNPQAASLESGIPSVEAAITNLFETVSLVRVK